MTTKGYFPTILEISATNLSDKIAKVCYLGLKYIIDNKNINYTKVAIIQA